MAGILDDNTLHETCKVCGNVLYVHWRRRPCLDTEKEKTKEKPKDIED